MCIRDRLSRALLRAPCASVTPRSGLVTSSGSLQVLTSSVGPPTSRIASSEPPMAFLHNIFGHGRCIIESDVGEVFTSKVRASVVRCRRWVIGESAVASRHLMKSTVRHSTRLFRLLMKCSAPKLVGKCGRSQDYRMIFTVRMPKA